MSELESLLLGKSKGGKITCSQALDTARKLGIPPKKVGETLNKLQIRIISCQLGCFP